MLESQNPLRQQIPAFAEDFRSFEKLRKSIAPGTDFCIHWNDKKQEFLLNQQPHKVQNPSECLTFPLQFRIQPFHQH